MLKIYLFVGIIAGAHGITTDSASAQADNAEYCDFRLYAPAQSDGESDILVLQRSDLQGMSWSEEGDWLFWNIEVADHAMTKWNDAIADSVGLSMSVYCGEELIASPVIRMPLGQKFKVTGMETEAGRWK